MVDTKLSDLTLGTLPEFYYGIDTSENSRRFNSPGFVNVKDYGAEGDGSTDDTAAIQAAFDADVHETTAAQNEASGQTVLTLTSVPAAVTTDRDWYVIDMDRPEVCIGKFVSKSGNDVTINVAIRGRGIANGDTIRFSPVDRGTIFFPPGRYVTSGPIYLDGGTRGISGAHEMSFRLQGCGSRTQIFGNFPISDGGYIFDRGRVPYKVNAGTKVVENMKVKQSDVDGGCIRISSGIGVSVRDVRVEGHKGIVCASNGCNNDPSIASAGTGYAVGDTLTVSAGTFSTAAQLAVLTIGGGGTVTGVAVLEPGEYTVWPTHTDGLSLGLATTTSGAGTGCKLNITWKGACQSVAIDNVVGTVSGGTYSNSCGVCLGGNGTVSNSDFSGYERALAFYGVGTSSIGNRLEVNGWGVAIGNNDMGESLSLSGFSILGGSMESNSTAIDTISGSGHGIISGINILGNNGGAPSGLNPQYGIRLRDGSTANHVFVCGITCGSNFDVAAIFVGDAASNAANSQSNLVFAGVRASNSTGPTVWDRPDISTTATFINCRDVTNNTVVMPKVLTFANLPAAPVEGMIYDISDATASAAATTWGVVVKGSGSTHGRVRYNGSNWTLVGQ